MDPFQSYDQQSIQEVITDLQLLLKKTKDNTMITGLNNAISKLNKLINNDPNIKSEEIKYQEGKYIGQVSNGLAEGRGKSIFNNGDIFTGFCKKGKAEGRGIKCWANGDRYEGEYKNDKKDGKGIYFYHNGDRYEGLWKCGGRSHTGSYLYKNGDVESTYY